jgi:hypothetical protein
MRHYTVVDPTNPKKSWCWGNYLREFLEWLSI